MNSYFHTISLTLWIGVACFNAASAKAADDNADLRLLRAEAIRRAASQVENSLARVEQFGLAESEGEVADDAPTVAVAIDNERHYIASAMVDNGDKASLILVGKDERRTTAKIIARDRRRQIVLLEAAEEIGTSPISIEQVPLEVGQTVIAVGKIAGDGSLAVASGILSATDRMWGIALQTDARVSSIFYGGTLLDLHGRVIGVIVPMVPEEMGDEMTAWYDAGVAFAIPVTDIQSRLAQMLKGQDIKPGLMGIVAKTSDPYVESSAIAAVRTRSPAAKAGLQAGDDIVAIDGIPIRSHREIKQILGAKDAGSAVTIRYRRNKQEADFQVTLASDIPPLNPQWLGMVGKEQAGADKSIQLIVSGVFEGSPASGTLQKDDAILKLNDVAIGSLDSLRRIVFAADPDEPLRIDVVRNDDAGNAQTLNIKIKPTSLAGELPEAIPESLTYSTRTDWQIDEVKLPDVSNQIVFVGPQPAESYESLSQSPGLLMLLADPGDQDLKKIAATWLKPAQTAGISVCLVAPATDNRWQPDEIDSVVRISASITSRYAIAKQMVAIGGIGTGAGSSMAMAVAMSRPGKFTGLIVNPASKPPAIRLRENDAAAPLQILITGETSEESPAWKTPLERLGFTIHEQQGGQELVLKWTRLLVRI